MVKATLLPYRDRIIYDGLLSPYRIFFGPGIRGDINGTYSRLKEREESSRRWLGRMGGRRCAPRWRAKTPAKPAPDWRAAVGEIVAQTEKMRQTDTRLQGAALGLLREPPA